MHTLRRWLYREKRTNIIARFINKGWAAVFARGIGPDHMAALDVIGRKSGKIVSLPVVIAIVDGERYLVSMLGDDVQWVQNVRAAHGKAYLRMGSRTEIRLEDVPVEQRAPILKAYLQRAPGARPHIPVDKDAPVSDFETIASKYPAFRIVPA